MRQSFSTSLSLIEERYSFSESFLSCHEQEICQAIKQALKIKKIQLLSHHCQEAYIYAIEKDTAYIKVLCVCAVKKEQNSEVDEYLVACSGSISKGLNDLGFCCVYKQNASGHEERYIPDDLIPILPYADLDRIAETILRDVYPRALSYAVALPVQTFAAKLGLHVEYENIDRHGEILGQIFFQDATSTVYRADGVAKIVSVKAGTIFASGFPTSPQCRNTVIHECVHWLLHRCAFLLRTTTQSKTSLITCRSMESTDGGNAKTLLERMEWQANALAPRLLMPAWATKYVTECWLKKLERLPLKLKMERVIEHVSRHFETSKQMTKIRLLELGYEDAALAFNYTSKAQYQISSMNLAREYNRNKSFRDALRTGRYVYVENHLVLKDLKYLQRQENGSLVLSSYAKKHPDECCLSFRLQRAPILAENGLNRGRTEEAVFMEGSSVQEDEKNIIALHHLLQSLPISFGETLSAHMARKHYTDMRLADASLLSCKTVHDYRSKPYSKIKIGTTVALCVGLHLHPLLSYNLIDKTANRFIPSLEHTAYQLILQTMTYKTIYECNDFLNSLGLAPLTGKTC